MQRQSLRRSIASAGFSHCQWPPPVLRRGSRKPAHLAAASAKDVSPEQPSTSGSSGPLDSRQEPIPVTVVEATVLEPETAPSDVGSSGSGEATAWEHPDFPELPGNTNRAAALQYGALGATYAIASGALAFAAVRSPGVLLPGGSDPWAGVLLGCLAATYLRAAGVFLHLKGAADNGELLCWRHQRLALTAAVYGIVAVMSQAVGVASLPLAGLQLVLAAATAVVVANGARGAWAVRPFVVMILERAEGSLGGLMLAVGDCLVSAVSTVAGVLLLAATVMSLFGFAGIVLAPAPSLPAPLGSWPGQVEALGAADSGLRRLVGCGLLLAAAQSHALLDFAVNVRRGPQPGDLEALKRLMIEYLVRTKDQLHKYYLPDPWTFNTLNASFVAAAALQTFFVLRAPVLGVDVNWDGALWGPMYGTCALTLLYGLSVLMVFDWRSVSETVQQLFIWAGDMVLGFFNAFVWRFEWAERRKRV